MLAIVYRAISGHLIQQARLTRSSAATGAVTFIQRFGSALNLNIHFHMLVPGGVYRREAAEGRPRFVPVPAPGADELTALVRTIAERERRRSGRLRPKACSERLRPEHWATPEPDGSDR